MASAANNLFLWPVWYPVAANNVGILVSHSSRVLKVMRMKCSCISYIVAISIHKCCSRLFYYYYSHHKGLALPRMEIALHILDHKMFGARHEPAAHSTVTADKHSNFTFLSTTTSCLVLLSALLLVGKLLVKANVNSAWWGLCLLCLPALRLGCGHPECHRL